MRFGILWGHSRVVIYVEPEVTTQKVVSNTARNSLRLNKRTLPWDEWGEFFQGHMPDAIKEMMEEIAAGAQKDHKDSIKDRLKTLLHLYKLSRYKRTQSGDVNTEGQAKGGEPRERQRFKNGINNGSGSKGTGNIGELYGSLLVRSGDPARRVDPHLDPPKVFWVSSANGTRERGDIEDRAAQYIRQDNTIKANAEFRVFADMVAHWVREYKNQPGVQTLVTETVREWFEQQLVEAVLGAQALHGSREWSDDDLQSCLSQEALTLAVMPRYHVFNSVKRTLGTKLGPLGR